MNKCQHRYQQILVLLEQNEQCQIDELAKYFSVSHMTIRRDIKKLQEKGLIYVSYGGWLKRRFVPYSPQYTLKDKHNPLSKQVIGQLASQLLRPNTVIFLDGGTTVRSMIPFIKVPLTVITLDLTSAMLLNDNTLIKLILCPGEMPPKSRVCYNSESIKYLFQQVIDMAFISADGFSLNDGALTTSQVKADCKWMAMQRALQSVLMIDTSKRNQRCRHKIADLNQFAYLVSEKALTREEQKQLARQHVQLISKERETSVWNENRL